MGWSLGCGVPLSGADARRQASNGLDYRQEAPLASRCRSTASATPPGVWLLFVKVRRRIVGRNPLTGQSVPTLRGVLEEVPGHVLCNAVSGALFLQDDGLPPTAIAEKGEGLLVSGIMESD